MTNVDAIALQQILDVRAARVDRIEPMPSPYFWEVLKNLEHRVSIVIRDVEAVRARLAMAEGVEFGGMGRDDTNMILANAGGGNDVMTSIILHNGRGAGGTTIPLSQKLVTLARSQSDHFLAIAAKAARAHEGLEEVKLRYQRFCHATKGGYYDDPFLKADVEEFGREKEMQHRILLEQMAMALPPMAAPTPAPPPDSASGLFGQQPTTSGGLFGAPAPSTGLFGASAPSTGSGGLFGAPAPAPATGGLFGSSAPAPLAFGQPAPAPSLFGAQTPAPSAFGTPAPAPSNLFGSAPAPAFGVAPTTPASTLAPRKKTSASRSGGRRR
jgi:hypothetical protein